MSAVYWLALIFVLSDMEPQIMAGPMTREECQIEADNQNRNNKVVRDPKLRELGIEFACLRVERLYV